MRKVKLNLNEPEDIEKILDVFNDGIYITNYQGMSLKANKAYEKITGLSRDNLIGKYIKDIVSEGTLSRSTTDEVLKTGVEVIAQQASSKGKNFVVRSAPVRDSSGNIELVVTTVRDVSVMNKIQLDLDKFKRIADYYKTQIDNLEGITDYVAESRSFKTAIELAKHVAKVDSTVLILGESGTGKEVIAKEIYKNSSRAGKEYIKINCAAIPEGLLESELFGYEAGAFTGAKKSGHVGVFEMASGGTLFLDEIGDMPLSLQVKLLRVLQEKTVTRIGGSKSVEVNVRIIAATNKDIGALIKENKFRLDLYYRINIVRIKLEPLRKRQEDIPPLVMHFVNRINKKYDMNKKIMPSLIKKFLYYDWPGNIRELENTIERIIVTSTEDEIYDDFTMLETSDHLNQFALQYESISLNEAISHVEKYMFEKAAKTCKSSYEVAKQLGISQPSASRRINKYNIVLNNKYDEQK